MRIAFVSLLILSPLLQAFSQENKKGIEYKYNVEALVKTKEVIWYGLDLSHLKISDLRKINDGKRVKADLAEFIAMTNDQFDGRWFAKRIKLRSFVDDTQSVQPLWRET